MWVLDYNPALHYILSKVMITFKRTDQFNASSLICIAFIIRLRQLYPKATL